MRDNDPLRPIVEGFIDEVTRTLVWIERRDKGGQQAPFFGDFASAPPSVLVKLRWWAREMRRALDAK